jgi:hypothetical protein
VNETIILRRILRGIQNACQTGSDNSLGYYGWWLLHQHDSDLARYVVLFIVRCNVRRFMRLFMIWRWGLDWTGSEMAPRAGLCGHLTGLDVRGEILDWMNIHELMWEQPSPFDRVFVRVCAHARVCFRSCQSKSVAPYSVTPRKYVLYSILTTGLQRGRIKWNAELTHFGSCDRNSSISDDSVSSGLNIISRDYQKGLGFTAHVLKSQRSVTVARPEWG